MEKDKEQKQAQGGNQPQGGPPQAPSPEKVQEQVKKQVGKVRQHQQQLGDAQVKYFQKVQETWKNYHERSDKAYSEYLDTRRNIFEGERKAAAQAPQGSEDKSPEQNMEAYKSALLKSGHQVREVNDKLREVDEKYLMTRKGFWDDVVNSVNDAVQDFWEWLVGWWEEPPVEGGAPLRALADQAWRSAFDPATVAYYSGWNYGQKLD
jgi:hypothetical protein